MSLSELSCAEAAADGASPSESSELRSRIGAADAMGSELECSLLSTIVVLMVDALSDFCFFFGCGSSVDEARCLDRTGTGLWVEWWLEEVQCLLKCPELDQWLDPS